MGCKPYDMYFEVINLKERGAEKEFDNFCNGYFENNKEFENYYSEKYIPITEDFNYFPNPPQLSKLAVFSSFDN